MGTSQSKPPPGGGKPLVPSWGAQDPAPPADAEPTDGAPEEGPAETPAPGEPVAPNNPPAPTPIPKLPPRPLAGTRRALRDYYETGDRGAARRAGGRYARSVGSGGAARHARAAQTGGGALAALARAANGLEPTPGTLDLRTLAGRPLEEAIADIVDAFCPPGILDEEAARLAVGEALFEVFGDAEFFDPTTVNDVGLFVAVRCFVAELVFASLTAEAGSAADRVPPAVAIARENGLRDLVREVTDHVATPILQNAGAMLAPEAVENVVIAVTDAVIAEMKEWE